MTVANVSLGLEDRAVLLAQYVRVGRISQAEAEALRGVAIPRPNEIMDIPAPSEKEWLAWYREFLAKSQRAGHQLSEHEHQILNQVAFDGSRKHD